MPLTDQTSVKGTPSGLVTVANTETETPPEPHLMIGSPQLIVGVVLWTVTVVEQLVEQPLTGSAMEAVTVCVPRLKVLVRLTRTMVAGDSRFVWTAVPSIVQTSSALGIETDAVTVTTTWAGPQFVVTGAGQVRPTVAPRTVSTVEQELAHPFVSVTEATIWLVPTGNSLVRSTRALLGGTLGATEFVCTALPFNFQTTVSGEPSASETLTETVETTPVPGAQLNVTGAGQVIAGMAL